MSLLKNIRNQIGDLFLNRQIDSVSRNTSFKSLEDAKTIGILFDSTDVEHQELVKKYVAYLREMRKKVKVIGYFNQKSIPDFTYSKLEYDYIAENDLNWYLKPSDAFITNFINEELDILIDLNIYDRFPLKYIAAVSKAKCKIGKVSDYADRIYDLILKTDDNKTLKYLLRQVDIYLAMMNAKKITS